ncbi:MAG: DUF2238 domain-containing protein [Gammaproteobacteria bacterium]|nr:DUF2238 domain-containing protein [Gammaproteobacteria bacterium]
MQYIAWIGFGIFWMFLAMEPVSRFDWLLENVLLVTFVAVFLSSYRKVDWTTASFVAVLAFVFLHVIGAHFTYSLVPYDELFESSFGVGMNQFFGWQRNQFDRLVHFAYGLLFAIPLHERLSQARDRFVGAFVVMLVMSSSLVYEFIEWGAVAVLASDEGMAFLGAQGDPWDAHKDMFLATLGSVITVTVLWLQLGPLKTRLKRKAAVGLVRSSR